MALFLETPERFGAAIAHLRAKRGWSQKKLADAAGTTQMTVSRIERSIPARFEICFALVNALDMSLAIAPRPRKEDA